jgi:hypothetical protein
MQRRGNNRLKGRQTLPLYTRDDYEEITEKLPEIVKDAMISAGEILEPTVMEKAQVRKVIFDWIRANGRKVYGGTALNEAIKKKCPKDAFYDINTQKDIEFYSPTPRPDIAEICAELYRHNFKYVSAQEAHHEGTYSIFSNFQLYCDVTFMPAYVYNGIKTIEIDGIKYVHPHHALIDQLKIFCQPLTAAEMRWEKTFKRLYLVLKHYPFLYEDAKIDWDAPRPEITAMLKSIRMDLLTDEEKACHESCLISGFQAYNFFVLHSASDRNVEQPSRVIAGPADMKSHLVQVPFLDLVSVDYVACTKEIYAHLKSIAPDPKKISWTEYQPFFSMIGYSTQFSYDGRPVVHVWDSDGLCIPRIEVNSGYMYVTFTYLLMFMLIVKFKSYLDNNRRAYNNYNIAISNLIIVRNNYLSKKKLSVINNSVFGEFRIGCVGTTMTENRQNRLKTNERYKKKLRPTWRFEPSEYMDSEGNLNLPFDINKHRHRNISGNKISNPRYYKVDLDGERGDSEPEEDTDDESEASSQSGGTSQTGGTSQPVETHNEQTIPEEPSDEEYLRELEGGMAQTVDDILAMLDE